MSLKQEIKDILHPPRAPTCEFCGRELILYKNKWICGHGCLKPALRGIVSEKTGGGSDIRGREPTQEVLRTPDSKPTIDFSYINWSYLADNSSFQRGVMEFIKKIVPGLENIEVRGSKVEMAKSFNKNKQNYIGVMAEFKEKLKKIKND